jgi:hypothetical protein
MKRNNLGKEIASHFDIADILKELRNNPHIRIGLLKKRINLERLKKL